MRPIDWQAELVNQLSDADFYSSSSKEWYEPHKVRNDNPYSYFETADDDTEGQYLLIDFGTKITIKGVLIAVDPVRMSGGHFDVYVYSDDLELDLTSSRAAASKCDVQNDVGTNAAGGTFNCGIYGEYLRI